MGKARQAKVNDQSEHERAEAAREEQGRIVEGAQDAIIGKDLNGVITSWNKGAEALYGYAAAEIVGKNIDVLAPPERKAEIHDLIARIVGGETIDHYETVRLIKDGRPVDVSLTLSPLKDASGTLVGVSTVARDVTERRRADERVRVAALYARSLLDASLDPLFAISISTDGKITDVNKAAEDITGLPRASLIGTDFADRFTEPKKARALYQEAVQKGEATGVLLAIRHVSGKLTDLLYNASVYFNETGQAAGVFAVARDITARKRAEDEARAASFYARSLLEASLDPLVTVSAEGKITDVNAAAVWATGAAREELIGTDVADYFTEPDRARAAHREVLAKGFVRDYPLAVRHVSGKIFEVLCNASLYRDQHGDVVGVVAVARDITERKRMEEQARFQSSQLATLLETTPDGFVRLDIDGLIRDVNDAECRMSGFSRGELLRMHLPDLAVGEPEEIMRRLQAVKEIGFARAEGQHRRKDGTILDVEVSASYWPPADQFVTIVRDITERKREEAELVQHRAHLQELVAARTAELSKANQRLQEANGELESFSYSVSHDLRAPLRAIDGFSVMLVEDYADKLGPEGQHRLQVLRESAQRMMRLIEDILAFSRVGRQEMAAADVDMEALARTAFDELGPSREGRNIAFDVKPMAHAAGDAAMLARVWTNLLDNAIKFTAPRDPALIEAGGVVEGGEAVYYVKDNGVGFDMQYADKLFGVFQRLHGAEFPGTGAGLAIVKRIVTRHGGRVWAEGKVDQGATIFFALPTKAPAHG